MGGSENISIAKDENRNIKGNKSEVVGGSLMQNVVKDIRVSTDDEFAINSANNLVLDTKDSMSLTATKHLRLEADSSNVEITTNYNVESGNQITHQVGETTITATSDSVIIKAGGVEVTIDSKGLIVKGGEVKSE